MVVKGSYCFRRSRKRGSAVDIELKGSIKCVSRVGTVLLNEFRCSLKKKWAREKMFYDQGMLDGFGYTPNLL